MWPSRITQSRARGIDMSKSWRDVLSVHPAADLFPMMSADELKALGEDIKKNGLHSPITLWYSGSNDKSKRGDLYLLDGRNRLDAMEAAGIKLFNDDKLWPQVPNRPAHHSTLVEHKYATHSNFSFTLSGGVGKPRNEPGTDPYEFV